MIIVEPEHCCFFYCCLRRSFHWQIFQRAWWAWIGRMAARGNSTAQQIRNRLQSYPSRSGAGRRDGDAGKPSTAATRLPRRRKQTAAREESHAKGYRHPFSSNSWEEKARPDKGWSDEITAKILASSDCPYRTGWSSDASCSDCDR